jgi:hypothetical protein
VTINYEELLTNEQKVSILQQRISQFAAEAWQHSLNRQTCEVVGDTEGVQAADNALIVLTAAITVHQEKLAEVEAI